MTTLHFSSEQRKLMKRAKWAVQNMAWDWLWGLWYHMPSVYTFPGLVWWWFSNVVAQQHLCVAFLWLHDVLWVMWHGYQLYTSMSCESGMQVQLILVTGDGLQEEWEQALRATLLMCSVPEHSWAPTTSAWNEFVKYGWFWECACKRQRQ